MITLVRKEDVKVENNKHNKDKISDSEIYMLKKETKSGDIRRKGLYDNIAEKELIHIYDELKSIT